MHLFKDNPTNIILLVISDIASPFFPQIDIYFLFHKYFTSLRAVKTFTTNLRSIALCNSN